MARLPTYYVSNDSIIPYSLEFAISLLAESTSGAIPSAESFIPNGEVKMVTAEEVGQQGAHASWKKCQR